MCWFNPPYIMQCSPANLENFEGKMYAGYCAQTNFQIRILAIYGWVDHRYERAHGADRVCIVCRYTITLA